MTTRALAGAVRSGLVALAAWTAQPALAAPSATPVSGTVRDSSGAVVGGATVRVRDDQRREVAASQSSATGRFELAVLPGRYALLVEAPGFATHQEPLHVTATPATDLEVRLAPYKLSESVTVTATPGTILGAAESPQPVNVVTEDVIRQRAKSVVSQLALEEPGLNLQRTSPTISGVYIRGLTGNKVNAFVDGVRFSTASARGGISTFMNLNDPAALEGVEVLRGPSSAQYGSDAIGGSVQYLLRTPAFTTEGDRVEGAWSTYFNSADLGFGSDATGGYARTDLGVQATLQARRVNTLRPGRGIDSHNAVTRFLGLPSDVVIGGRIPDTAFTQYGGSLKAVWALSGRDDITASYSRSQQDGGKRYDQLLGGDGNLVAELHNLMLDLGQVRYTRREAGPLDRASLGYSYNAQREERVNQGGNGNPRAAINHEYEKTRVHGLQTLLTKTAGRHSLTLGGELYRERITAPSFSFNPVTSAIAVRRGRVPDQARFNQTGVYAQDVFTTSGDRLELVGSLRWSRGSYDVRAADSPLVNGRRLWSDDSLDVDKLTYRAGAAWRARPYLTFTASVGTGFRAPHVTDLGTLGLTGSGYEVSFDAVEGKAATVGTTADRNAVSYGLAVEQQKPESSRLLEASVRYRGQRLEASVFGFVNDVRDNITKQSLILPPGAVGTRLGDEVITSQIATGAVFVAASTAPVLVRSNFDDARIWGIEHVLNWRLPAQLHLGTVFTYLHAEDRRTGTPPNIEGGTPAPEGWVKLRWAPAGRGYWVEPYVRMVARNESLSTLDLEDRRSGATRSHSSIASFFNNGARARGLVGPGPDGRAGTADDVLLSSGETLPQVQARVLGSASAAPLFPELPGFALLGVRGGFRLAARHDVFIDLENATDRSYRGVSWGVDGPGRSLYVRYRLRL